jgi:hypothetical protein
MAVRQCHISAGQGNVTFWTVVIVLTLTVGVYIAEETILDFLGIGFPIRTVPVKIERQWQDGDP